jgi:hypothetical protein
MYKSILTMKKKTLQFVMALGLLFLSGSTIAQDIKELGFSYQAVARDNSGLALANKNIVVEISIRQGSTTGITLWQETHQVATNKFGLFNVVVGKGVATGVGTLSSFDQIDWSSADYFTNVRADFGNGLLPMGVVQLQATPYAFVADTALAAPRFPLSELLDVDVTTLTTNDVLKWNGSAWIPGGFSNDFDAVYAKINADSTAIATDLAAEVAARIAGDAANASAIANNTADITTNATAIANNTADISTIETDLAAEITRATNAETAIAADLVAEETARIAGDAANATAIANNTADISTIETDLAAEITRATNAETAIAADLVAEETARIAGDAANATAIANNTADISTIETDLAAEITRATNAETAIAADLVAEETARIAGDAANATAIANNTADISTIETDLAAEITRATNAETAIAADLVAEETARIAGDAANATAIANNTADISTIETDLAAEITRATNAETAIAADLVAEETARIAGDAANATAIANNTADISTIETDLAAEITRATNAETAIAADLVAEETARIAGDAANATAIATETTNRTNADALKADIASPTLTGVPAAPTATAGTNTTQIATTAFVTDAVTTATPDATTLVKGKVQLAGDLTGTAELPTIANDAVTTAKILDANVTTAKIADNAVRTAKILDANVTDAKIATGVDAAKLADGSVSNTEFQYIDGATSNIQTQLDAKAPIASPTFTGTVTAPTLVSGDVTYPNTDGTAGQVLTTDGSGELSWTDTYDGLTHFTESTYTNSGKTGVKLLATNAEADVDVVIGSKGTGALLAQEPDGTEAGGNNRGDNAVDLQMVRDDANQVASGNFSTISGGDFNTASGALSTVSGGRQNVASGSRSTISGGDFNTASGNRSTVSGGQDNTASGNRSTISGGRSNTATSLFSTVSGGENNTASGEYSFVVGRNNNATSLSEIVLGQYALEQAGDPLNFEGSDRLFAIGNGIGVDARSSALTVLKNGNTTIAGTLTLGDITIPNTDGTAGQVLVTDGSGELSWSAPYDGLTHFTESTYTNSGRTGVKLLATNAEADVDVVIGRKGTGALLVQEPDGTEAGGNNRGDYAVDLQMVRDDANQVASGDFSTISGGDKNRASGGRSTVSGGRSNRATGTYSTISGGEDNTATTFHSTVSGGRSNTASSSCTTVSGGENNTASTSYSTVSGGRSNTASGTYSTILGGESNTASGRYSVVVGRNNNATSLSEIVLGQYALEQAGNPLNFEGSDRLFAIGNGTASNARSSALTVLKNGNTTIAGTLTLGDITIPNTDGTAGQVLVTDGSGELSWAAASLTHFTESTYLYDTKNGVKLVPNHAEADVDVVIGRKGTGALLANQPDGLASGGNNRGLGAIDLQTSRGVNTQVASGDDSNILGGINNTASGFRSSVVGGFNNTSSGQYSLSSGRQTNASGDYSVALGHTNTSSGDFSIALGFENTSSSFGETTIGLYATNAVGNAFLHVPSDRLFAIGNGTAWDARSNALTVLKNGNTTIAGTLTLGDITIPNTDGTAGQVLVTDGSGELSWAAAADGSETKVTAGTNVTVTGAGTTVSPYVVNAIAPTSVYWESGYVGSILFATGDAISGSGSSTVSSGITLSSSSFMMPATGTYILEFQVNAQKDNVFQGGSNPPIFSGEILKNDVLIPNTGTFAFITPEIGFAPASHRIIFTANANDLIKLVYTGTGGDNGGTYNLGHSGSPYAFIISILRIK